MQPAGLLLAPVLLAAALRCARCESLSKQLASVPPVLIQRQSAQLTRSESTELLATDRFQACGGCARCVVGANQNGQAVGDGQCQSCAMGAQTWWPCNVQGLCVCDSSGPIAPEPTTPLAPAPTTPAPTRPATTTPAPTTTSPPTPAPTTQATTAPSPAAPAPTASGAAGPLCGGCDSCVAVADNAVGQAVSDSQCAPCARNGQSWWPCKLQGEWSSALCHCAGSAGPAPSPTPSPAPTGVISPVQPTPAATPAPTSQPSPAQPAPADSLCSAAGPSCDIEPGEGISGWFTKEIFDQMFPNLCSAACHGCQMLKYECLIKATVAYPEFANSSSLEDNKRELAAWLGQMSQETTGGGCGASDESPDGTCSCGSMWCDSHPGGCSSWGLCFVEEAGGQYCSPNSAYPCKAGREYRGRGPKQLSWNYNYGQFSEEFCGDRNILLDNPDRVASNPTLAWASSMWFWFTGGACLPGENCKPNCHEVFLGTKPMCGNDRAAGRQYGLGWVTNIINGGLECGGAGRGKCDYRVHSRVRFYKHFCDILGVNPLKEGWSEDEHLFCHEQSNYVTVAPQTC